MSAWQVERQIERQERQLERDYEAGLISAEEYRRELQQLQREYRDDAQEAARDAYDRELENW